MLAVDKIDAYYGSAQVLFNLSIHVEKGEIVALVGSNGAGKTTLLHTILGIVRPRAGSISFLGKRIDKESPSQIVKMGICHIPGQAAVFPYMTTLENLYLGAYFRNNREETRKSLNEVYEMFPVLYERRKQNAGTLSGGERQMLSFGRGLMSKPELMLIDEPSFGLAPILVDKIFSTIRRLNEEGLTILLVEQNVHWALSVASRGYVISNGKTTMEGDDLLNKEEIKSSYLGL